jgi:hypothetical protein
MKMMFYLVDTNGKELAECLEKATADCKLPHDQYSCKMYWKIKLQNHVENNEHGYTILHKYKF